MKINILPNFCARQTTKFAMIDQRGNFTFTAEIEEMRKNWAAIAVYYGEMSFQVVEETVAYTWMDMIGE